MKSSYKKLLLVTLFGTFFVSMPFLQSLLFVQESKGSMEINRVIQADFLKSDKKIVLLFFGYVGCKDICTPLLERLHRLYISTEFDSFREDVEIVFVNLTPEVEVFQADLFAKFFDNNFRGVYLSRRELLNIDRDFGLFFSQNLSDKSKLNHTDYIYLLKSAKREKVLKSIYSIHPLHFQKLKEDIMRLQQSFQGEAD